MEASAAARARPRRRDLLEQRRFLAPALISPAIIAVALVVGVPFGWAIYLSLTDAVGGSLSGHFIGIDNFVNVWHDPVFRTALENTLIFTFASQAVVLVGASILSHFLVRDFRGKWLVRFLVILPWAAPVVLSTLGWLYIFDSLYSVINWTLVHMHLVSSLNPPQWLGRENLAKLAIIMVHAWRILPFAVVIFIAGLSSIPTEVEDAAKIDGATGLRIPLLLVVTIAMLFFARRAQVS